jgi:hypothetical protein
VNTVTPKNPGVLASGVSAWSDVRDALSWLFRPALISFVILLALGTTKELIIPIASHTVDSMLKLLVYEAIQAFVMTPYAIAVHRFIILGEITTSYRIPLTEPRFRRFFGWSLALVVLTNVPTALDALLAGSTISDIILGVVLGFAVMVLTIRTTILFPAVAVDAPGADWRHAIADTSGHAWDIFLILFVGTLPFLIVASAGRAILQGSLADDAVIAFGAFDAIVGLVGWTLVVVIASRVYQWIGAQVKGLG